MKSVSYIEIASDQIKNQEVLSLESKGKIIGSMNKNGSDKTNEINPAVGHGFLDARKSAEKGKSKNNRTYDMDEDREDRACSCREEKSHRKNGNLLRKLRHIKHILEKSKSKCDVKCGEKDRSESRTRTKHISE
jgi:hypothetical protein